MALGSPMKNQSRRSQIWRAPLRILKDARSLKPKLGCSHGGVGKNPYDDQPTTVKAKGRSQLMKTAQRMASLSKELIAKSSAKSEHHAQK